MYCFMIPLWKRPAVTKRRGGGGGDEFCAVKPWLGAIVPPTAWSNKDSSKAAPFLAALSDVSAWLNKLHETKEKDKDTEKVAECYKELTEPGENIFNISLKKMSSSGLYSNEAPESDELELSWIHG